MATLTKQELRDARDLDLGASDWVRIEQKAIDAFAEATNDHNWIHVDPERAAEGPFGSTIGHGYLSLSLIPGLLYTMMNVTDAAMGLNYGVEKVRFTAPLPVNSEVRLKAKVVSSEPRGRGHPLSPRRGDRGQGPGQAGDGRRGPLPDLLGL